MELQNGFSKEQIGRCLSNRIQDLIILPTEKCNFRCSYCYEDFELGRMSELTQVALERLISSRAETLDVLNLSWFGGEPLLAKDVVLRISRHALKLSERYGFKLTGGCTTNGYLLDTGLAQALLDVQIDFFQISLDGWKQGHDETRKMVNGAGSFDVIWNNLLALRNLSRYFEVSLRIHLSTTNFESVKELCFEIGKEFGADPRFRIDFQDIRDMGGSGSENIVNLEKATFAQRIAQLSSILRESSGLDVEISSKLDNVGESAGSQRSSEIQEVNYICYASKPNSLLIRSNGRLGKCTVAFDNPANDIGELLADGSLQIDNPRLRKWFHGFSTLNAKSLGCPLHGIAGEENPVESIAMVKEVKVPIESIKGLRAYKA